MLHIKLTDRTPADPELDGLGRAWWGYDPNRTAEENFEHNRGLWKFDGKRAANERYAAFTFVGEHKVKFVAAINGVEQRKEYEGRKALIGEVLPDDHPVAQAWIGQDQPDKSQNPITYHPDDDQARVCACGCGEPIPASRAFAPGHDQRAVHDRISQGWGNTLAFVRWFDESKYASTPGATDRGGQD